MLKNLPSSNTLEALIPISRFNKGEASKIIDEVTTSGFKIVVKNNAPVCVMLSPQRYRELLEELEDEYLLTLALERLSDDTGITYTSDEIAQMHGFTPDALDKISMEYGVDFE
jgi:PHD/YefM family antitoxin component YafN of YafNO toxin-antitoxin module